MSSIFSFREIDIYSKVIVLDTNKYVFMIIEKRYEPCRYKSIDGFNMSHQESDIILVDRNLNFEHHRVEIPGYFIDQFGMEKNFYKSGQLIFEIKIDKDIQFLCRGKFNYTGKYFPCDATIENNILHIRGASFDLRQLANYDLFEEHMKNQIEKSEKGTLKQEDIKFYPDWDEDSKPEMIDIILKLQSEGKLSEVELQTFMKEKVTYGNLFEVYGDDDFFVITFRLWHISIDDRITNRVYIFKFSELDYEIQQVQAIYDLIENGLERQVLDVLLENLKLEKRKMESR